MQKILHEMSTSHSYYFSETHCSRGDCLVTLVLLRNCSVFETKLRECFSLQGGVTMWLKASNSHRHRVRLGFRWPSLTLMQRTVENLRSLCGAGRRASSCSRTDRDGESEFLIFCAIRAAGDSPDLLGRSWNGSSTSASYALLLTGRVSSPRTPSWSPGLYEEIPSPTRTAAASGRRTWRPASRGRRRAASARRGTPRCRRACPLCT